jgi:hypothetical protein
MMRGRSALRMRAAASSRADWWTGGRAGGRPSDRLESFFCPPVRLSACLPACPPGPHCYQRAHHLSSPLEHSSGIVIAEDLKRLAQWSPLTRRDPLIHLRTDFTVRALEQKKMTILVDMAPTEAEMPVDHANRSPEYQVVESGFLCGFTEGSVGWRFITLEMPLGEPPVVVRIANQQVLGAFAGNPPENDTAGTDFQLGATLAHQNTEILRYFVGCA